MADTNITNPDPDVVWVVMNKGTASTLYAHKDNTIVTRDHAAAVKAAYSFGFDSPMGVTKEIGMQSTYRSGAIWVDVLCTVIAS